MSKLQWQCIQSVLTRERESTDVRAVFTATPVARCLSSSSSTSPSAHYSAQSFTLRLMNITSTSSTKSSLSKSHHNHPKQRPQPLVFCSDICTKSESNPKCLSKSLDKTNPNKCVIATKRNWRQKCAFFQLGN